MIRFCDREVGCAEYGSLTREEMLDYFLHGHMDDMICVYEDFESMKYLGIVTYDSFRCASDVEAALRREYVVWCTDIWQTARNYFYSEHEDSTMDGLLPVLNEEGQLICFAYEDEGANREVRMLRELQETYGALSFTDVYPEYKCVRIYEFNELAYYLAKYLEGLNVSVEVVGTMWQDFFRGEECQVPNYECLDIYAEGVGEKNQDWRVNLLRSASVEFECIDKIYETNIKHGIIKDADGDFEWLLEQIRDEKEIVVIGTDLYSLNVANLLLNNGIDILCFTSENQTDQQYRVLGKKVLSKCEIRKNTRNPIFLECRAKNSAWGEGGIDQYDYEGYRRNQRFFLVKDYTDIPIGNLQSVLKGKKVILIGNLNLCYYVNHSLEEIEGCNVTYWDLLREHSAKEIRLPSTVEDEVEDAVCLLVEPQYFGDYEHVVQMAQKKELYLKKLREREVYNVTDYFSNNKVLISIEKKSAEKYTVPYLTPDKILLNISGHMSGNAFLIQILDGHPDILLMNSGIPRLISNLFLVCVQLAEERADNIIQALGDIHRTITSDENELSVLCNEVFKEKLGELLAGKDFYTSQELFVILHMAYERIWGQDLSGVQNKLIYYEPREDLAEERINYEKWLCDKSTNGFSILLTRNSYIRLGSFLKHQERFQNFGYPGISTFWEYMACIDESKDVLDCWKRFRVKFETLKTDPKETLMYICDELKLSWSDSLLETTARGRRGGYYWTDKEAVYGFDLRPVYNLYEKYFSEFDRFRINMIFSSAQRRFDYPYVSCMNFSRRQLQEMFLKKFRFESQLTYENDYWRMRYRKDIIEKVEEYFQRARREEICSMGDGK